MSGIPDDQSAELLTPLNVVPVPIFTDGDLQRLKKTLLLEPENMQIFPGECEALVLRLEAAERVCEDVLMSASVWTPESTMKAIEAWHKAAGR